MIDIYNCITTNVIRNQSYSSQIQKMIIQIPIINICRHNSLYCKYVAIHIIHSCFYHSNLMYSIPVYMYHRSKHRSIPDSHEFKDAICARISGELSIIIFFLCNVICIISLHTHISSQINHFFFH